MVIDGWDPEIDWLNTLLQNAGEMPYESIYLFGANPRILKNDDVKYLIEEKILVPETKSFAQFLSDVEYFETEKYNEDENGYIGKINPILSHNLPDKTFKKLQKTL